MSIRSIVTLGFFDNLITTLGFLGELPPPSVVYLGTRHIHTRESQVRVIERELTHTRIIESGFSKSAEL